MVADTCPVLNRKCRSFDMENRLERRPEIEPHFWDGDNMKWPTKGKDKPDLVIFDPPAIAYRRIISKSPFLTGQSSSFWRWLMGTGGQVLPTSTRNRETTIRRRYPPCRENHIWIS